MIFFSSNSEFTFRNSEILSNNSDFTFSNFDFFFHQNSELTSHNSVFFASAMEYKIIKGNCDFLFPNSDFLTLAIVSSHFTLQTFLLHYYFFLSSARNGLPQKTIILRIFHNITVLLYF